MSKAPKSSGNADLVFLPLGGVGEIGMNLALYGYGQPNKRKWIMVDCGVTFPGPTLPGADLILPDISFVEKLGDDLLAIVITHAHEDHYGALLALWPRLRKPVHCTAFVAGMLEAKRAWERDAPKFPVTLYRAGDNFNIGPFDLTAVHVTHSIPEPVSLAISTPLGTMIHTGDWKLDEAPTLGRNTDLAEFERLGKEGVLALICDSTNAMRSGVSPSEEEVSASLAGIISNASGRVAITTFSSNVGRIRSIAIAAREVGRKVMLLGSSIRRVVEVATDLGYFDDIPDFLDQDDFKGVPRRELVIVLTGSQGESRAALAKIANKDHPRVDFSAGDTVVFSSRTIPGNEKPIIDIKNGLIDQGIEVISDDDALVHVSGHPRRSELEKMYSYVKPQIAVPVHGEAAHLSAHAKLAAGFGVPQVMPARNGDMVRLAPGPAQIIDQLPHGRIYLDGKIIGNEDQTGISERRKLSWTGVVAVSVLIDGKGRLVGEPGLDAYGVPEIDAAGEPVDDALFDAVDGAVKSIPPAGRKDEEKVANAIRRSVRNAARQVWGKKPITMVFVTRV